MSLDKGRCEWREPRRLASERHLFVGLGENEFASLGDVMFSDFKPKGLVFFKPKVLPTLGEGNARAHQDEPQRGSAGGLGKWGLNGGLRPVHIFILQYMRAFDATLLPLFDLPTFF
jgi:hypothetical protein